MTIVGKLKISPHEEKYQMSPHDRCGEIWNSPYMACVWCRKRRHICKIYAIFCHNLRAFTWRKIEPKSSFVEKKWQISGLCKRKENIHINRIVDNNIRSRHRVMFSRSLECDKKRIMNCENDSPQIGDRNMVVTDLCLLDLGVGRGATICQKENLLRKNNEKLMFMPWRKKRGV